MDALIKKILVTSAGDSSINIKPNKAVVVIEKPLHYTNMEDLEELRANLVTAFCDVFIEDVVVSFNLPDNTLPAKID